jgi:hypothetical protein
MSLSGVLKKYKHRNLNDYIMLMDIKGFQVKFGTAVALL